MTCRFPRKRKYRTAVDAMLAMQRIWGQRPVDDLDKYERGYYRCGDHFHLTSWRTQEGP